MCAGGMYATELQARNVESAQSVLIADDRLPEDDLATARGFALGMGLGAICLAMLGAVVWFML